MGEIDQDLVRGFYFYVAILNPVYFEVSFRNPVGKISGQLSPKPDTVDSTRA